MRHYRLCIALILVFFVLQPYSFNALNTTKVDTNLPYISYTTSRYLSNGHIVTPNQVAPNPLGKDMTPIYGNTEVMSTLWNENSTDLYKGSVSNSVFASQNYSDPQFSWFSQPFSYVQPAGTTPAGDPIQTSPPRILSGDFDGNLKNDYLLSYLQYSGTSSSLVLELRESINSNVVVPLTGNIDFGFPLNQTYTASNFINSPAVATGNLDSDYMTEIGFVGKDLSGNHKVWILDDLLNSTQPSSVNFGDSVLFRVAAGATSYLTSKSDMMSAVNSDVDLQSQEWQFQLLNPNNLTDSNPISIGSQVAIKTMNGLFWSVDQSGIFSLSNVAQITQNQIFTITDTSGEIQNSIQLFGQSDIAFKTYLGTYLHFATQQMTTGSFKPSLPGAQQVPFLFKVASRLPSSYTNGLTSLISIDLPTFSYPMNPYDDTFTYDSPQILKFADIDNDGLSEILVVGLDLDLIPTIWIFDDALHGYSLLDNESWLQFQGLNINIAVGNLNSDPQDEIVLSFTGSGLGDILIFNFSNQLNQIGSISDNSLSSQTPKMIIGDITNDGLNELLFLNQDGVLFAYRDFSSDFVPIQSFDVFGGQVGLYNYSFPSFVLNDIDSDGTNELLITGVFDTSTVSTIVDYTNKFNPSNYTSMVYTTITIPHYLVSDITGDYTVLKFSKTIQSILSPKEVVLLSASAPYVSGTSQNPDLNTIQFGTNIPGSNSDSNNLNISYGSFISADQLSYAGESFLIDKTKTVFSSLILQTATPTEISLNTLEMSWSGKDNYVIYSQVEFSVYDYTISNSPDPRELGSIFSLYLPETTSAQLQPLNEYITQNEGNFYDLTGILTHISGNPSSYETKDQLGTNTPNVFSTDKTIGTGSGTTNLELTASSLSQQDREFSTADLNQFGFYIGGDSYYIGLSQLYSFSFGQNSAFQSQIANFQDNKDLDKNQYQVGMSFYPFSSNSQNIPKMFILNFWTSQGSASNRASEATKAAGAINKLAEKLPGFEIIQMLFPLVVIYLIRRKRHG